jgi:hypothetical protein
MAAVMGEEPRARLGTRFWVIWVVVMALAAGGFVGGMWFTVRQHLWSPVWGSIAAVAYTIVLFALIMMPYVAKSRMKGGAKMRAPHRRYLMRFMPAMLVYGMTLIPATAFYKSVKPEGWLAWAVAIAPAIPVLFAIRAVVLYYREEDDEFLKAMAAQSQLLAMGLAMAICTVYGFLDLFGLVPHVEAWAVFPLWAVCLMPAQLLTWRKFK